MRSKKEQYQSHLIIPDSHAKAGISNDRFKWLGNYVIENQPDVVIDIGDSADMTSLCKYDIGHVRAEGRRYKDDLAAYHDAMRKLMAPINKYNNTHTKWKKKTYRPRFVKCRGNHEYRIHRAACENPAMYEHISYEDLKEQQYGWEVHDYLETVSINDIAYQHFFTSGIMGRPIGGINHAATLVRKGHMSCVCGHSHMRDFWEDTDASGRKVFGLVVGCYFTHNEEYTTENDRFWRGLVHLKRVYEGQAEPSFINIEEVRELYG